MSRLYQGIDLARLFSKVNVCEHGSNCKVCCWPWIGFFSSSGTPQVRVKKAPGRWQNFAARVFVYKAFNSDYDPQKVVTCLYHNRVHHRACCNHNHLTQITRKENLARSVKEGWISFQGEKNSQSKTTTYKVLRIRGLYDTGEYKTKEIAEKFSLSVRQVQRIISRESWSHL